MIRLVVLLLSSSALCRAVPGMLFSTRIEVGEDGVLERTVELSGAGSGRIETGFDPAVQSVEVLEASIEAPGGSREDLPGWAVDTLAGSGGFPSLLVTVFPPGARGLLKLRIRDWSWPWAGRLWFVVTPPEGCDSSVVVAVDCRGIRWEGEGWTASRDGRDMRFSAGPEAGILRASFYGSWQEMYEDLTRGAREHLESELPLSVREAALEASAGGADHTMLLARLRTILCNSIAMVQSSATMSAFVPLDPGTVLDRRRATRMEAAVLFTAMARSAGVEAELVLASSDPSRLPIPGDWDRVLVDAGRGDRRALYEPHATLVPAAFIPGADGLQLLRPGDRGPVEHSPPPSDRCREIWAMRGHGEWLLEVDAGGRYDGMVRRRLAGLDARDARSMVAAMLWRSGIVSRVDSCWTGDLFDLSSPASFGAIVRVPCSSSSRFLLLPALTWESGSEAGDFVREWELPEGASHGADLVCENGAVVDTLPFPGRRLFGVAP